mmetsp:Transcript_27551/g.27933  ORF Transcript_27551/g.27933 Transcript_27551/m.27933 type:complete len:227 (-) Transcript_27551:86-766(-)
MFFTVSHVYGFMSETRHVCKMYKSVKIHSIYIFGFVGVGVCFFYMGKFNARPRNRQYNDKKMAIAGAQYKTRLETPLKKIPAPPSRYNFFAISNGVINVSPSPTGFCVTRLVTTTSAGLVRNDPIPPANAPIKASPSAVLTSTSISGFWIMYSFVSSNIAIWIAPNGTSLTKLAPHVLIMDVGLSLSWLKASIGLSAIPLCIFVLAASEGARTTEPTNSPAPPARR